MELTWGDVRILRRQKEIGQNLAASHTHARTTLNLIRDGWAFPTFKFEVLLKLKADVPGTFIGEELDACAAAYETTTNNFLQDGNMVTRLKHEQEGSFLSSPAYRAPLETVVPPLPEDPGNGEILKPGTSVLPTVPTVRGTSQEDWILLDRYPLHPGQEGREIPREEKGGCPGNHEAYPGRLSRNGNTYPDELRLCTSQLQPVLYLLKKNRDYF